ncbi:glycosyltransferase family 4 protein [Methylomonas montana]|uniref:glycosyltransferase family 4 protein n=1 Tax=Methylomonas montana TaxID=3058963 RepID=UPI00265A90EB|nr:glycosyltransferase family 4 protein [Methylomonas montana]WKJ90123.1 glycosyltransferase family 4 protein [Methylomonas montana]
MTLHIGIAGPIATEYIADLLTEGASDLPVGYPGAPLTGVLITELLRLGYKVSAFTTDPSLYPHSGPVKASGVNFDFYICPARPRAWRFNKNHVGRAIDGFAYERQQLFNAMKLANPNIIHAHWTYEFALAAIKTGLPHLITCHDAPAAVLRHTRSPYRAIRYLMARQVFWKGQHFSAVSNYMSEAVQHYTSQAINVIPNPLANYVISNGRIRTRPPVKHIGMVCNGWDDLKNPKAALMAFAKIHRNEPMSELHLFGREFGAGESAQQWCQQQGIAAGMIFHGATPHKQLIERLNRLDLLLHPSLEESFGVVIAEAMALGLPIVAGSRSGAVPWVVGIDETTDNRCCAVLTDVSDLANIASAIEEAFDEYYSERSSSGHTRALRMFAPKAISESYLAMYRQALLTDTIPKI